MKLFEITWEIIDGQHEYIQREIKVFPNLGAACRYGVLIEHSNNIEGPVNREPTERQRELAREDACLLSGRVFRFNGASEFHYASGEDGLYEVKLGKKLST